MNAPRRTARILPFKPPRARMIPLSVLRAGLRFVSRLSARLGATAAEALFRTPPHQRRTRKERALLESGRFREVWLQGRRLATWSWGEGPTVLLVHGWGGHAARLASFVAPLREAGFGVVAFDAPAHGSSDGVFASLPEFAAAVRAVAEEHAPLAGLVAHSMGGAAATLAMRDGLPVPRAVFLAPPEDPERYSVRFANYLKVSDGVRDGMKARLLARYGITWDDIRLSRCAPSLSCRLLVFHDRGDFRVPLRDGLAIVSAWPGAELVVTRGFGHHKILRHPDVVSRAVRFLGRRTAPAVLALPELGLEAREEAREESGLSAQRTRLARTTNRCGAEPVYENG